MIRVLFFGKLRDQAGTGTTDIETGEVSTVADVTAAMEAAYPALGDVLSGDSVRCAVNGEMSDCNRPVRDGDEIAFLPPVSGG